MTSGLRYQLKPPASIRERSAGAGVRAVGVFEVVAPQGQGVPPPEIIQNGAAGEDQNELAEGETKERQKRRALPPSTEENMNDEVVDGGQVEVVATEHTCADSTKQLLAHTGDELVVEPGKEAKAQEAKKPGEPMDIDTADDWLAELEEPKFTAQIYDTIPARRKRGRDEEEPTATKCSSKREKTVAVPPMSPGRVTRRAAVHVDPATARVSCWAPKPKLADQPISSTSPSLPWLYHPSLSLPATTSPPSADLLAYCRRKFKLQRRQQHYSSTHSDENARKRNITRNLNRRLEDRRVLRTTTTTQPHLKKRKVAWGLHLSTKKQKEEFKSDMRRIKMWKVYGGYNLWVDAKRHVLFPPDDDDDGEEECEGRVADVLMREKEREEEKEVVRMAERRVGLRFRRLGVKWEENVDMEDEDGIWPPGPPESNRYSVSQEENDGATSSGEAKITLEESKRRVERWYLDSARTEASRRAGNAAMRRVGM